MKKYQIHQDTMKKNKNTFVVITLVLFMIVAALLFAATNIFVLEEKEPAQAATYSKGKNATISAISKGDGSVTISLTDSTNDEYRLYCGGAHTRQYYRPQLTFTGTAAYLYRNGALKIKMFCEYKSPYHSDSKECYMKMQGPGGIDDKKTWSPSTGWKSSSSEERTPSYQSNSSDTSFTINFEFSADDGKNLLVECNTDTYIKPYAIVSVNTDNTAPTVQNPTYETKWSKEKKVTIKITDNLAGVNPNTIKVNGKAIKSHEYDSPHKGRDVTNIETTISNSGSSNLIVEAADYLGNKTTKSFTIDKIDDSYPVIKSELAMTVDGVPISSSTWTNKPITLTGSAQDTLSGIKEFVIAGTTYSISPAETGVVTRSKVIYENGTYSASVKDAVGWEKSFKDIKVTNIDTDKPTVSVYYSTAWTNGNVRLYITASDTGGSGVKEVTITAPGISKKATVVSSGSLDGRSCTHYYDMLASNGRITYEVKVYDNAGNVCQTSATATPNIDTTPPIMETPDLIGYRKGESTAIDASLVYSYTNITVNISCSDSESGLKEIELNGQTKKASAGVKNYVFNFAEIITKNTIQEPEYSIKLTDVAGNQNTIKIYPLKDSEMPHAIALSLNDWASVDSQNVTASVWFGKSGGRVDIRRTYLSGADGQTIATSIVENIVSYPASKNLDDDFYGPNKEKEYKDISRKVTYEGEEYYHFRLVSNAGEVSPWYGIEGQVANTPTLSLSGGVFTFSSNGARTRIDRTAPQLLTNKYTNGSGVSVSEDELMGPGSKYIAEEFFGEFIVNDGISVGGSRTNGINGSGLFNPSDPDSLKVPCVSYTVDMGLEAREIEFNWDLGNSCVWKFGSNYTMTIFEVRFSNQNKVFYDPQAEIQVPTYTFTVKDRAGNTATYTKKPKIDDTEPTIEIVSVLEKGNEVKPYNLYQLQHNYNPLWVRNPIEIKLRKTFGISGATIAWGFDPNPQREGPPPSPDSPSIVWQTANSDIGTIEGNTLTSEYVTITIQTNHSFNAALFLKATSGAQKLDGTPITKNKCSEQIDIVTTYYYYFAIDANLPEIIKFEFTDESGQVVQKNGWSPSQVNLHVYATDIPTSGYTLEGSGIKSVNVKVRNTEIQVPMQPVNSDKTHWQSVNRLPSEQYEITIEDNVGNWANISGANRDRYLTHAPNIDTLQPMILASAGTYNSLKGYYSGGVYYPATPTNQSVTITLSSEANKSIKSGAQVYYMKRSVNDFQAVRYSVESEPGHTLINLTSQPWVLLYQVPQGAILNGYPLPNVGTMENPEEHAGFDFLIVTGAGKRAHLEFGTVFVDMKSPSLMVNQIEYIRDDGQEAVGVIPDINNPLDEGNWTNASVTAKLYVYDGLIGAGIDKNQVKLSYQKDGIDYIVDWQATENLDSHNNGFYIFTLDSYIEYTLRYADLAGNIGQYTIRPLIDREPVSISLSAMTAEGGIYNIDPSQPGGVSYIDKNIVINISLQFGLSSFAYNNYTFQKGTEKYRLLYSPDNKQTIYDITAMMGSGNTWTNPADGSVFQFLGHNNRMANYRMVLTENQNRSYFFEVWNGISEANASTSPGAPSRIAVPSMQTDVNAATVKIDQTPPTISNIVYSSPIDAWTADDITVTFEVNDNQYGSGVLENTSKSVVMVKRDVNSAQTVLEIVQLTKVGGRYQFVMDGYYNYYIEFEDRIGNGAKGLNYGNIVGGKVTGKDGGIYGPIRPLIDKLQPEFVDQDGNFGITATSNNKVYDNNWTYHNVSVNFSTTVGISGQTLQLRTKISENSPWSQWIDITGSEALYNGTVEPLTGITRKNTLKVFSENTDTLIYEFRVISGAGLSTVCSDFGWIKIDKVNPTISVMARAGSSEYTAGTWTKESVRFTLNVTRGKSGSIIEVTTNKDDPTSWGNGNATIGILNNALTEQATLERQSTTNPPVQYYFRVTSMAGLSATYEFGTVKIDKQPLSVNYSFVKVNEEDLVYSGGKLNYEQTWVKGQAYNPGQWTSTYIMVMLKSGVGPSGASLMYTDEKDDSGNPIYKDSDTMEEGWKYRGVEIYNKAVTSSNNVSYMLLKEDQNRNYSVRIVSGSGNSLVVPISDNEGNLMIDKSTPYMKLNIVGTKSDKWTANAHDLHKWFIAQPVITFDVGWFIKDQYGNNVFQEAYPISGATIYSRYTFINAEGYEVTTEWSTSGIENNAYNPNGYKPTLRIPHNADAVRTYEFKIVSGAGKEFYIKDEYANPANYQGKNLWVKALDSDQDGEYTIKVDTNDYIIDIQQWLKGYMDGMNVQHLPAVQADDMAQITVMVNGQAATTAKRGSTVTVTIDENVYDPQKGYGYIYKRAEYYGVELNTQGDRYIEKFYSRQQTSFSFDIFDENYKIKAYFTKEIRIDYYNLTQVKQNGNILPVEVSGGDRCVSQLRFTVLYTGESHYPIYKAYNNSTQAPVELGEYDLEVLIANDNPADPNYKIHNPVGSKELILYFDGEGTAQSPYRIYNSEDIGYINIYNDPDAKYNFLGENRSQAYYLQMNNVEIADGYAPIYGEFTGIYNGNQFEIFAEDIINAQGNFGIFESVNGGKIMNLGIKLSLLNISQAQNAGFLAGSVFGGAEITNCYAIGEMYIASDNGNVGGLVGYAYGLAALNKNYTDVAISNKGKVFSGNIGGLIGLMDQTKMLYAHAIGAVEIYNVDTSALNAGVLAGKISSVWGEFMFNKYLYGNLFVNDAIENNGGAGFVDPSVASTVSNGLEGLLFNAFINSNIGRITIADTSNSNKEIRNLAIRRIRELGMEYGIGTGADPFLVNSEETLSFIDKYVWAHYVQIADITLTKPFNTIAAHKVFTGSYDGMSSEGRHAINKLVIDTNDNIAGMFGRVAGSIRNVDIRDLNINMTYEGGGNAYVGALAAILQPKANIVMIYALGNITASAPNALLNLGGIVGYAEGKGTIEGKTSIVDILALANVKTLSANALNIGGTAGFIDRVDMRKVFSLGRVEGNYSNTGSVGAIVGRAAGINNISDYYALKGNTYAHGQSYDNLAGYSPNTVFNETYLQTFEQFRGNTLKFESDSEKEIDEILDGVYPLQGKGTLNSPFLINNEEEFAYINDFLYANYRIKSNLDFTGKEFKTIGVGAKFTGSINAAMTPQEYIENGNTGPRNFTISGLTDAFVYYNAGTIRDIRFNIQYNKVHYEETVFGTVCVYNAGTIQGVVADGYIILKVVGGSAAIVGGFVGQDLGGTFTNSVQEPNYEVSSINNIQMSVVATQINAGGFVGRITGHTFLSYLISNGDIICTGGSVLAGTVAGAVLNTGVTFENEIEASARVYVNNEDRTRKYGFNINQ